MRKRILTFFLLMIGACLSCGKNNSEPQHSPAPSNQVEAPPETKSAPSAEVPAASQSSRESSTETAGDFEMPPFHENPDAISLKPIMDPASVVPAAQPGYVIAKQKPELLAQLPCFCYCNRFGHTSLQDCFTTDHAATCDICLKEALEADQMQRSGLTAPEIRAVIVSKYHPKDHSH